MRDLFITFMLVSLLGCHNYRFTDDSGTYRPDTIYLPDSIHYEIIIIRDTIWMPHSLSLDSFMRDVINPFPGFIIDVDHWIGDSLLGVWMQWGEGGPWHFYRLDDSSKQ